MGDIQAIEAVLHDESIAGRDQRARIFELLSEQPDRGAVAGGRQAGSRCCVARPLALALIRTDRAREQLELPAERLLKLQATALPFELKNDPSFFSTRSASAWRRRTATPMPFVVSMTGDLTPYGLVCIEGCLYGFWCDDCCVSSIKYQEE